MTGLVLLAAALTGAAVLLARPPAVWSARRRLGVTAGRRRATPTRRLLTVGAIAVALVLVVAPRLASQALPTVVVGGVAAGVGLFASTRVVAGRRRATVARRRVQVGAALDLLSAELRAGVLPSRALVAVSADLPLLAPAGLVASHGGDVPAALRGSARVPGAGALDDLAQAWAVAERVGAPLSMVLDRVAEGVRTDLTVARESAAEAAPARATGRLMAALPLLGLALGSGLGAQPVRVLLTTVPGAACLAIGAGAGCAGVWWIDRIADRVLVDEP